MQCGILNWIVEQKNNVHEKKVVKFEVDNNSSMLISSNAHVRW